MHTKYSVLLRSETSETSPFFSLFRFTHIRYLFASFRFEAKFGDTLGLTLLSLINILWTILIASAPFLNFRGILDAFLKQCTAAKLTELKRKCFYEISRLEKRFSWKLHKFPYSTSIFAAWLFFEYAFIKIFNKKCYKWCHIYPEGYSQTKKISRDYPFKLLQAVHFYPGGNTAWPRKYHETVPLKPPNHINQ